METVLFRQVFPKQPITRHGAIIFYMVKDGAAHKFVVHNEWLDEKGEWFRERGGYYRTYEEGLNDYLERCEKYMRWYKTPSIWERIQIELKKQRNS